MASGRTGPVPHPQAARLLSPIISAMSSSSSNPLAENDSENTQPQMTPTLEVRFDEECVLIPDQVSRSRLPLTRFISKSYSLPLWKRRSGTGSDDTASDSQHSPSFNKPVTEEPEHFPFTIAIPRCALTFSFWRNHNNSLIGYQRGLPLQLAPVHSMNVDYLPLVLFIETPHLHPAHVFVAHHCLQSFVMIS